MEDSTMTRTTRTSLLVLAAALTPAIASAQHEGHATAGTATVQQDSARRVTKQTSSGTVSRRPMRRAATTRAGEPRAHPRDYVRADSNVCDDLCQRERRLDRLYGKDRERMPGRRSTP
jgi:hypothetical protein